MGMHEPTEGVHLARERVRAEVVRWEEAEVKQATRLHWRARVDLMGLTWRAESQHVSRRNLSVVSQAKDGCGSCEMLDQMIPENEKNGHALLLKVILA